MKYAKEYGLLLFIFIILIVLLLIHHLKEDLKIKTIDLNVVATNVSKLEDNSIWCPTLQLIWNDLKSKVIGQDIVFINDEENVYATELNKEAFTHKMINPEYYYSNYGYMTPEFRDMITNDIMEKFNEKSDILGGLSFTENSREYFLYSMLVRKFTFRNPFDIFGKKTFGISDDSDYILDNNVRVIFYEDNENYAVRLITNEKDEVILYKGERGNSFNDTYALIREKTQEDDNFDNDDVLTVARLKFKVEKNNKEISKKNFMDINGNEFYIDKVIQTMQLNLDNTGGEIKGEPVLGIDWEYTGGRDFDFTDDFVLFLKEESKDTPYLGLNITDIEKFQ